MISSLLRLVSIVCCLIIAVSFAGFASDQAGSSSKQTVAKLGTEDDNAPGGGVETRPAKHHGAFRQKVDKANDVITHPFTGIASSGSRWQQRIVAALLGFLLFGVGLGFLGRYAAMRGV